MPVRYQVDEPFLAVDLIHGGFAVQSGFRFVDLDFVALGDHAGDVLESGHGLIAFDADVEVDRNPDHDAASMALGQYSSASAAAAWCAQPGSGGRHSAARASLRAQVRGGQSVTVSSSATVPVRGRYTPRMEA